MRPAEEERAAHNSAGSSDIGNGIAVLVLRTTVLLS